MTSSSLARFGAISLFFIALPALAVQRSRAVATMPDITISGIVRDAATGAPLSGVKVHSGSHDAAEVTGADGRYTIRLPQGRPHLFTTEHFAYESAADVFAPGPAVSYDLRLRPLPAATVRTITGQTYTIPMPSLQFGYFVVFVGATVGNTLNVCKPDGKNSAISKNDIARFVGPATVVDFSPCCTRGSVWTANIELKSGDKTAIYFNNSCFQEDEILFGRDRATGAVVQLKFTDVAEVNFP